MGYASQSGRARTSSTSPQAHAICDRCGFRYNWVNLKWQFDWRGAALQNTRVLICNDCNDTPQEQLRAIVVPADPTPIMNARVQDFALAETDFQTTTEPPTIDPTTGIPIPGGLNLQTEDGLNLTTQPIGYSKGIGLDQNAVMPLFGEDHYGVQISLVSVTASGTDQISVTCNGVHGLSTNDQISVQGLSDVGACGFFSITVTTATAFTYQTNKAIPAGALLTSTTNMITALVGLPYNYGQIPQTGG